ncbi:uncharacterized protein AMSG_05086 [Thecamonas trahens ATCC 50062]|uniref:Methyltransferase domain-containing protein n=1 Tax=Thecamonas trahens ATCC 50062 TaxID=461836 RepID=A0A0L0DAL5_THETB|nr:hypothetical protein AMSG_05086 [Thecamonas trahens ATCC 50062]KNC49116.1 hypothetical protein AMSG_05086 [Thecamonas trahens ATCC 50062]|eukprot:XP_013758144.1 hypothetical protein AMSG_05086 [Thecamonas trahens ATCC 50062]
MYEEVAGWYAAGMDDEMAKPMYAEGLPDFLTRVLATTSTEAAEDAPIVDVGCGSADALAVLARLDRVPPLVGLEPSAAMRAAAAAKIEALPPAAASRITIRDGSTATELESGSCRGIICFFVVHHVAATDLPALFAAWSKALVAGGQIYLAAWEGEGVVDYGGKYDIDAVLHPLSALTAGLGAAGLVVDTDATHTETDPDFGMSIAIIKAHKPGL